MNEQTKTEQRACVRHGQYEASNPFGRFWTGCPGCERDRAEAEERRRMKEREATRLHNQQYFLRESGIAGRYLEATFESFVATSKAQRAALAACREYVDAFHRDQGSGLFLVGPPGTGKTHLGCAMVREIILRDTVPAHIASARAIVRRLRNTWARDAEETEDQAIADLAGNALLVLDELGCGFGSDAEMVQMFDVIDRRYERKAPTIVLSNLTPAMLKAALGDRSYDRLREGARTIVCDWPSHRGSVQ